MERAAMMEMNRGTKRMFEKLGFAAMYARMAQSALEEIRREKGFCVDVCEFGVLLDDLMCTVRECERTVEMALAVTNGVADLCPGFWSARDRGEDDVDTGQYDCDTGQDDCDTGQDNIDQNQCDGKNDGDLGVRE